MDAREWQSVSLAAFSGVIFFAGLCLWFGNHGERWFTLLDGANLLFHEFGHSFVGLFSAHLSVYGGTLAQFIFPIATAVNFWRQRAAASFAVCIVWLCQNLFNIARYMADARAKELPLVGGRDPEDAHDWAEILSRWGLLRADKTLAGVVTLIGWLGIVACCVWLLQRWRHDRASEQGAAGG